MGNKFSGEGNLGQDPEVKRLDDKDAEQAVCNLRIYFDKPVPTDDGFEDKGGFWMNVEIWGKRAIRCGELLKKGQRVAVDGSIIEKSWKDKDSAEDRSGLVVRAKRVNPDLMLVNSMTEKNNQG